MESIPQIEAAIRAAIKPVHAEGVEQAVAKARKLIYNKEMNPKILDDIGRMTVNDPQKLAIGVMGIMSMMRGDKNARFEDALMVPVASLTTVDLIQFLEEAEMFQPTTEFIGNAFEELYAVLMQKYGIGPGDRTAMAQKAQELDPNNPEVLAQQQPGLIDQAAAA